jgi:hypothetical protein
LVFALDFREQDNSVSTQFYNTVFEHSSDATFRAWGLAFSNALAAAGTASGCLTIAADTGQINWATVARPGVNTAAGFEVWKLTDSNFGAAPIYIKIEYGTGAAATTPQMWVTIGTSTNGSGTLSTTSTRVIWTRQVAITSNVTLYPTYISSNEGSLTVGFKLGSGSASTGCGFLGVGRPCNLDGSIRTDAGIVYASQNNVPSAELVRFSDGTKFGGTSNHDFSLVVYGVTATTSAGSFQAYQHVCAYPEIYGVNWIGTVLASEIPLNTSDTATFYGATSHTYVSLGVAIPAFSSQQTAGHGAFMLYE